MENYAVMEFTERGVNLMQVSANNISNAAAYQQPFPKITFDMKPGEMRKNLADKVQSGAVGAQNIFCSGSEAVLPKEERKALEYRWSHTVIHGVTEFSKISGHQKAAMTTVMLSTRRAMPTQNCMQRSRSGMQIRVRNGTSLLAGRS